MKQARQQSKQQQTTNEELADDNMRCSNVAYERSPIVILGVTKEDAERAEFKAGIVRSMEQYNAGLVKTFDNVDDFLADLNSPE